MCFVCLRVGRIICFWYDLPYYINFPLIFAYKLDCCISNFRREIIKNFDVLNTTTLQLFLLQIVLYYEIFPKFILIYSCENWFPFKMAWFFMNFKFYYNSLVLRFGLKNISQNFSTLRTGGKVFYFFKIFAPVRLYFVTTYFRTTFIRYVPYSVIIYSLLHIQFWIQVDKMHKST